MIKQIDYDFSSVNQILPAAVHKSSIKTFEHYINVRVDYAIDAIAEIDSVKIDYYAGAIAGVMAEDSDINTVNRIDNGDPRWAILKMEFQGSELNGPMIVSKITATGLGQDNVIGEIHIDGVQVTFTSSFESDAVVATLDTPVPFPNNIIIKIVRN